MMSPGNSSVCREQALIVSLCLIEGFCAAMSPFPSSLIPLFYPLSGESISGHTFSFQLNIYLCRVFDLVS